MGKELNIQINFEYKCKDNTLKKTVEKAVNNEADLRGADLREAALEEAVQWGAKNWNLWADNLYSLKMQNPKTKLRYWKYLDDGISPYQHTKYEVGKTYTENDFDPDERNECGKGLNVATLMWCLCDCNSDSELIEVEFYAKDIVAVPYFTDGKFRVKKFKVLRKISVREGQEILDNLTGVSNE